MITKDKNIVRITAEYKGSNRTWTYDINTATLYGLTGKPITRPPYEMTREFYKEDYRDSPLYAAISWVIGRHYATNKNTAVEILKLSDRLASLNLNYHVETLSYGELREFSANFKAVLKYIDENGNGYDLSNCYTFSRFYKNFSAAHAIADIKKSEQYEQLCQEAKEFVNTQLANEKEYDYEEKTSIRGNLNKVCYHLNKGLWEVFIDETYMLKQLIYNTLKMCDDLHCELTKDDFIQQYRDIYREHELYKDRIMDEKLTKHQSKNYLSYEDDEYISIIPKTMAEFIDEGTQQSNCVARLYAPRVADGETNIIFIRKKDNPSKSYITCEVGHSGHIAQFLKAHNIGTLDNSERQLFSRLQTAILDAISE